MKVFLKPGEIYISDIPTVVSTILGSCVAITMYNKRLGVGGICHAMLPNSPYEKEDSTFRYVDRSIPYMLKKFEEYGIEKNEMELKLLGGADVINRINENTSSIGQKNIEIAMNIIKKERLILMLSDVGGKQGRKIHFYTKTGEILLKRISGSCNMQNIG
ncbi:MAG TPA: chemotaxis protein CheD [Rikenellaceae bacterium]|nr:chemotaxis protein CheD [Rikenellaceae bacterium]